MEKEQVIIMMVECINDMREGQGIFYYNNGDREMGDYYNDEEIGKHVMLTSPFLVSITCFPISSSL